MNTYDAYLAGLFDGEGYVSTLYQPSSGQHYNLVVGISLRNQDELLGDIADEYEGVITYYERYTSWHLHGVKCRSFIEDILPYTKIKKERLIIGVELLDTFVGLRGKRMTPELLAKRKEIVSRLRVLQEKGRSTYTDGQTIKRS